MPNVLCKFWLSRGVGRLTGLLSLRPMEIAELCRRSDENYAAAFAALARANGLPVEDFDGLVCTPTGVPAAALNMGVVTRPLREPHNSIARATAFFDHLELPFVLRIREGIDPAAEAAAEALGLPYSDTVPGMALSPIPSAPPLPAGFEIRVVRHADELGRFQEVSASGFDIPIEGARLLMREAILSAPSIESYIGYAGGLPVATSTLARSGRTAGVYNVATLASHRGRGYGEAMTWRAVVGGQSSGCDVSILQASDMGRSIYERMGFRLVAPYRTFHRPE